MDRFELLEPLYRRSIGGTSWKKSVIDWAVEQVGAGVDTPNLRILAGLRSDAYEVDIEAYFERTLRDLGQEPLGDVERRLGEARAAASALLRGELEPVTCTQLIHRRAVGPLNHPSALQPWCDLDSGFVRKDGNIVRQLEGDPLEDEIRKYAAAFVATDPAEQLETLEAEVRSGTT